MNHSSSNLKTTTNVTGKEYNNHILQYTLSITAQIAISILETAVATI
jgi:hypothetical protein